MVKFTRVDEDKVNLASTHRGGPKDARAWFETT
jgi:hypothetical protein